MLLVARTYSENHLTFVKLKKSAPFQHLDTCIRFPSLASILAPHFSPQADHADFVVMYKMVIERLNKGHTTLAFSLLSKFPIRQFAETCTDDQLAEMIFSLKSAFFALSGDANEQNLDFDLPDSSESADLVKAIIGRSFKIIKVSKTAISLYFNPLSSSSCI